MKKKIKIISIIIKDIKGISIWFYRYLKNPKAPKISEKNGNVLILGNGPSVIKEQVLKKRNQLEVIAVNKIYQDFDFFSKLKPEKLCFVDQVFFNSKKEEITKLLNLISWPIEVITLIGFDYQTIQNKNVKFIFINTNYIDIKSRKIQFKLFKNNMANPGYQNVINSALYYAISAKYNNIFIYGVDNDWHRELTIDNECNLIRNYRHFYGTVTEVINIEKKFINYSLFTNYIYFYFNNLVIFSKLKSYANNENIKIFNLSLDSYLDMFQKKAIEVLDE